MLARSGRHDAGRAEGEHPMSQVLPFAVGILPVLADRLGGAVPSIVPGLARVLAGPTLTGIVCRPAILLSGVVSLVPGATITCGVRCSAAPAAAARDAGRDRGPQPRHPHPHRRGAARRCRCLYRGVALTGAGA